MKILVVDENPADLHMQADLLALEGCVVIPARSVVEAIRFITTHQPNLILADVLRFDADMAESGSVLRAMATIYDIGVVAVTNGAGCTWPEGGILGCAGLIPKPIDARTFASEVLQLARSAAGVQ